jgi:hypothetical protein
MGWPSGLLVLPADWISGSVAWNGWLSFRKELSMILLDYLLFVYGEATVCLN